MKGYRLPILMALAALMAGCARQPWHPPEPIDNWEQHRRTATQLESWQISGKLGLRLPDDNASARLRWRQEGEEFRIDLSGPLGQGRIVIRSDGRSVRLIQSGADPLEAASADELVWQATGWLFPASDLLYWVRGIAAPGEDYRIREYTPEGLLKTLEQDGWTIHFSRYQNSDQLATDLPLPGQLVAEQQDTRLTLIIHQWKQP